MPLWAGRKFPGLGRLRHCLEPCMNERVLVRCRDLMYRRRMNAFAISPEWQLTMYDCGFEIRKYRVFMRLDHVGCDAMSFEILNHSDPLLVKCFILAKACLADGSCRRASRPSRFNISFDIFKCIKNGTLTETQVEALQHSRVRNNLRS